MTAHDHKADYVGEAMNIQRIGLTICLAVCLVGSAVSDLRISKGNYHLPTLRTFIFNPRSVPDPCVRREFRVKHRRDANGKPYAVEVLPMRGAEKELVPAVTKSFLRWKFSVPMRDDWRKEYLAVEHENTFWSEPPCNCLPKGGDKYKFFCQQRDQD